MNRTTAFSASIGCLAALWPVQPTRAADEDVQLWVGGSAVVPLAQTVTGTFEVSARERDAGDQLLTRANADYALSDRFSLGGAVAYVFAETGEFRLHQQATFTTGPLAFRTRAEQRFFDGADRAQLRLREKVTASWPLAQGLKASLAGELLYIARSEDADRSDGIDQWRAQATLTRRLSSRLEGAIGYLMILAPREGTPDRLSHVAQVTLTFKP